MVDQPISVRPAGLVDRDSIASILSDWLIDPATGAPLITGIRAVLERIETSITGARGDCEFVVATAVDVLGVCGLQWTGISSELLRAGETAAEVVTAYVRRVERRRGVGQAMLKAIERRGSDLGFSTLLVVSGSRNREHGYPFWRRRYGEPFRCDDDYFAPGAERVVWRHELDANA